MEVLSVLPPIDGWSFPPPSDPCVHRCTCVPVTLTGSPTQSETLRV